MAYRDAFMSTSSGLPANYAKLGTQNSEARARLFQHLVAQRLLPDEGWDDQTIEIFINELASMDSNNYISKSSVGEREGRIYSSLVAQRHYRMSHGIGRSGDLEEAQPKAAGSSLMSLITNGLVMDFMKSFVCDGVKAACLMPVATGMSINLILQSMMRNKPNADTVLISRCDQKSCLKAVTALGLKVRIVNLKPVIGELITSEAGMEMNLTQDFNSILCMITTTSCFAPRTPDDIRFVAKIVRRINGEIEELFPGSIPIFHLVNNAYGVQSEKCAELVRSAARCFGRVDAVVQSTDKNLMVPVGGSIIVDFGSGIVQEVQGNYPGRASASQTMDVLITLLKMGKQGYKKLLLSRQENFAYLNQELQKAATSCGEFLLSSPKNDISIGISLTTIRANASSLGAMLFQRNVLGARVVIPSPKAIEVAKGLWIKGWGAHTDEYPRPYLTAAATIGMTKSDVDVFINKFLKSITELQNKEKTEDVTQTSNST